MTTIFLAFFPSLNKRLSHNCCLEERHFRCCSTYHRNQDDPGQKGGLVRQYGFSPEPLPPYVSFQSILQQPHCTLSCSITVSKSINHTWLLHSIENPFFPETFLIHFSFKLSRFDIFTPLTKSYILLPIPERPVPTLCNLFQECKIKKSNPRMWL